MYCLEQGPTERTIIEQCARQHLPLPERIANAPELLPGLEFYYGAFLDCSTCRSYGGGSEGPIPWLAVDDYIGRKGIIGEQAEDVFYHVQQLDNAYRDFKNKKAEAKAPKKSPKKRR